MKIGVIGAGRLGICFALLMEKNGYDVVVSDIRKDYVESLNNKSIKTNEPEVEKYLANAVNFKATTFNNDVIDECDIIYTLVATPSLPDGSYDINAIWNVIEDIKSHGNVEGKSFVVGCTTNPGDCDKFQKALNDFGVDVYYNPEFIAQGSIIKDLKNADMVLIGGNGKHLDDIKTIYQKIQVTEPIIKCMSTTAAEITKIAINCYLTTKISFANMVGQVLTSSGHEEEILNVLSAIGSDTRIGNKYFNYGFGFGGPCLPRDNRSFGSYMHKLGMQNNLGKIIDYFNAEHLDYLFNYFKQSNEDSLPFYFNHVSYKKGTDMIVESQRLALCKRLLDAGYKVYISDEQAVINSIYDEFTNKYNNVNFVLSDKDIKEKFYYINL